MKLTPETWGPWQDHTPGPCPVAVGTEIEIKANCLARGVHTKRLIVNDTIFRAGNWRLRAPMGLSFSIDAYRIRTFGAMAHLRSICAEPTPIRLVASAVGEPC